MTRLPTRAALLAAGWRNAGAQWYPPWPSSLSYTYRAAQLEQARQPQRKVRRIIIVQEQPHE